MPSQNFQCPGPLSFWHPNNPNPGVGNLLFFLPLLVLEFTPLGLTVYAWLEFQKNASGHNPSVICCRCVQQQSRNKAEPKNLNLGQETHEPEVEQLIYRRRKKICRRRPSITVWSAECNQPLFSTVQAEKVTAKGRISLVK